MELGNDESAVGHGLGDPLHFTQPFENMQLIAVYYLILMQIEFLLQNCSCAADIIGAQADVIAALDEKLLRTEGFDEPALADDAEICAKLGQLGEQMAGNENGDILFLRKTQEHVAHLYDALRIETVYGFVKHHDFRPCHQGHGNAKTLPHTEGEFLGDFFTGICQPHEFQHLVNALFIGNAAHIADILQVFFCCHTGIHDGVFDHEAHAFAVLVEVFAVPEELHTAACWHGQTCEHTHDGGFSGAVGSDQSADRTLTDGEGKVFNSIRFAVFFGDLIHFEDDVIHCQSVLSLYCSIWYASMIPHGGKESVKEKVKKRLSFRMELVAHAPDGVNILLIGSILLDFAAQIAHMYLDGVVIAEIRLVPDALEEICLRKELLRMPEHERKNGVFLAREGEGSAVNGDDAACRVEGESAQGERRFFGRLRSGGTAAENGFHPDGKLIEIEGLCQIIIRAHADEVDFILYGTFGGENDDRNSGEFPQLCKHPIPAAEGEHQIEQNEGDIVLFPQDPQGTESVKCRLYGVADAGKIVAEQAVDFLVILCDEKLMHGIHLAVLFAVC